MSDTAASESHGKDMAAEKKKTADEEDTKAPFNMVRVNGKQKDKTEDRRQKRERERERERATQKIEDFSVCVCVKRRWKKEESL
jgi:hypothetical protein